MRVDHDGDIWDLIDFGFAAWSWSDFISDPTLGNFGWAMLDTAGCLPIIPSAGYITRTSKIISKESKAIKVVRGFGNLSKAEQYGIKSYGALHKTIKGTGLHAHHIIEKRFANILELNANDMLSVAVTITEHQKFTNDWRKLVTSDSVRKEAAFHGGRRRQSGGTRPKYSVFRPLSPLARGGQPRPRCCR